MGGVLRSGVCLGMSLGGKGGDNESRGKLKKNSEMKSRHGMLKYLIELPIDNSMRDVATTGGVNEQLTGSTRAFVVVMIISMATMFLVGISVGPNRRLSDRTWFKNFVKGRFISSHRDEFQLKD
ncbi:hypothetical protein B0H10DRAFT_1964614 [Mycena sp. CBHHK59/15]|nr:hypothetical protein B0H10DRAFT_1964614 [Mycena sp. CBHHK59/15]